MVCAAGFAQQPAPAAKTDVYYPVTGDGWARSPYSAADAHGQTARLAQQYVKTEKEDERREIRKKLTETLAKQFEERAKQQQKELEDLEKQVAKLKEILRKRQDNKSSIIERRLEQLIQEAEGMGWNAPSSPPSAGRSLYGAPAPGPGLESRPNIPADKRPN
jgi:hypothetical protein